MLLPRIGITTSPGQSADRPADVLNRAYIDAVAQSGGLPLVLPILDHAYADAVLDTLDGLVLSGGGDIDPARYGQTAVPEVYGVDERRDEWELALVRAALRRGTPVLGICRGAQVLNVSCGGTLIQDLSDTSDCAHREQDLFDCTVHRAEIDGGSKLAEVIQRSSIGVNTLHHQAVDQVGRGLCAVAWAEDGTIEAIECDDSRPVLGVQWHPELLVARGPHRRLFSWVVDEATAFADARNVGRATSDEDNDRAVA
jgi:putative glutamine amidotransferase